MINEFKFRKGRIFLSMIFFVSMLALSISFLLNPETYLRNVFSKTKYIQLIGIIGIIFYSTLIYSFVKIFNRKYAIRITEEFLIDNSKYESLGKIKWSDISKIQRLKKRTIEVVLNTPDFKSEKSNLLKRFLRFMQNWNHKESILISSALLDCSIEELFETISVGLRNYK